MMSMDRLDREAVPRWTMSNRRSCQNDPVHRLRRAPGWAVNQSDHSTIELKALINSVGAHILVQRTTTPSMPRTGKNNFLV